MTHSIIVPTHNRPELLRRAVASAIVAAETAGEVIVVDDASDISAEEVLFDMAFDRLRCFRNSVALAGGGSPSRNIGARHARADVLFFLDDDDELLKGYCASVMSSSVQTQANFGFSAREFSSTVRGRTKLKTEKRALPSGLISEVEDFRQKTFPFSAGFWIKKSAYEAVGPMEVTLRTNSDTEYACRLYASSLRGWYSAIPGVRIHEHTAHATSEVRNVTKRTKSEDRANAFAAIVAKHASFLKSDPSAGQFVYARMAKHAARAGCRAEALSALKMIRPWTAKAKAHLQTIPYLIVANRR